MSGLKQKSVQCYASIPESGYIHPPSGGPLPFRSRAALDQNSKNAAQHRVKFQDSNAELQAHETTERNQSFSNEHVKAWLLSTSPTSIIGQAHEESGPLSPSPTCSPSPSSPVPSSGLLTNSATPSSELNVGRNGQPSESCNAAKHTKSRTLRPVDAPPDSPTGNSCSKASDGGLIGILTTKLFPRKEYNRSSSQHSKERSGHIDDKHMVEDRSSKPSIDEMNLQNRTQHNQTNQQNPIRRAPSEAASEISFASANDRTLSMEFDAILAAAVAAGVSNALRSEDQPAVTPSDAIQRENLAGVHEESPIPTCTRDCEGFESHRQTDEGEAATVMPTPFARARQGHDLVHECSHIMENKPLTPASPSGRLISEQTEVRFVPPSLGSISSQENARETPSKVDKLADLKQNPNRKRSNASSPLENDVMSETDSNLSPSSSENSSKENVTPNAGRQTLEKVRRNRLLAQAIAFQDAKNAKYHNRYKREEAKINAWENQQRINASVNLKKAEMKLEEKRAKAMEKMQNDIASAHKKAEERKASAHAVRGIKSAKVAVLTDNMRQTGKISAGCFPF